uniref:Zinc finger protein 318 n=1 Tax=Varanus komodoensis TaxID=61221 RepID=A0A8D2J901_VARKO
MYRASSGRSNVSSSSRSKESNSSGSRSSRSGGSTSGSVRGRSPRRSRSPSPRGRRHRSPSSTRSSRRSPSPRRSSRIRSPSGGSWSCLGSEQRDSSLTRRRSPGWRSHSPRRRSRSPCSHSPGRRSPTRHSRSPGRRSPGRHSHSPSRHSPSRHSESSVEQSLRITVGNDRYGIDTPERKRLSDRLGSPVDSLSDVDRDDLADGPIFSRGLSHPRSLERYPSRDETPSSPFSMRHDEDYHSRDVFVHQSDYSMNYDHLHDQPRETDRGGELLRKSLYSSEDRGREPKRPRYDRDDRLLDMSIEPQGFVPTTRNYRKRSLSRSPSPTYLDEDFRELESARRKREEEELSRNMNRELSSSGYMMHGSTNPVQSSEPRYLYRPDDAPAMPKKSILKKRVEDFSVQPEVFSSSPTSVKEPPLLSNNPPLPQRNSIAPFSLEVENFLKRFNKNAVAESTNKESQSSVHDWRSYSGIQQNSFSFEQNSGNFLKQKEPHESTSEPVDRHSDFLLPHERVSQDGSGFSRILGMIADSTSSQEKRRRSFPDDIEDEEKFLYGDDEDGSNVDSPSTQKLTLSSERESLSQKVGSPPRPSPPVKPDTSEQSRPEYEKIHDLLKTIGLDIGVAEIGKLAARTQERLHGKKPSRSPDRHLAASCKAESRERRHSQSNTHSPESSQKRSLSPSSSFPPSKEITSISNSEHNKSKSVGQDNPTGTPERSVPPISLIPSAPPLPNLSPPTSVSQYRVSRFSPFPTTQLPQNYPSPTMAPPGYDAYGHYMAYAASGWRMYAQQADPALSDVHGLVTLTVPPNPTRPNLRVIETVSTGKGTPDIKRDESVLVQIPTGASYSIPQFSQPSLKERISDERNRASQKQKVIEEREKLKAEQEARQKKLHYLRTELNRLSKQQGEMLRKKRREKDGHKDPLLVEVNRLQENIVKEIAQLKMSADAAEKKQSELDKVAQILGINIFEKSRKLSSENKDTSEKNKSEFAKSQERTSNSIKESKPTNDKPKGRSPKPTESSQPSKQHIQGANIYDYYDTGNHWCKDCNTTCGTMFDFFTHMHNKKHRQTLDPYNRPWASKTQAETKQEVTKRIDKIPVPAKGSEFLIPVTGYYCQLCHEFFGDQISAEQHVKSHPHNEKYKKHVEENPLYEERRNLDRQAGLSVIQETERRLKRKQCEKQKEEKDEKTTKVVKKEETKNTKELGDGDNEYETSKRKDVPNGQKCGIKLKLKKDDKEVEKKAGKKEESAKESRLSSFGKFSWRKAEREEKNQDKDVCREDSTEESKEKESKTQSGKPNSKPIAIRLSGKTVIPHTSPWTPVVSTSSQAKIRPNLPVPMMVLRKSATTTVSKPAPLNTFLSIKSSGATTKPLPVVKEGNSELVLAPDIISKAFGGEVVVLKNSQENAKTPEQPEEQEHESVTKAIEHAKALEHAKTSAAKAQEQAIVVAKAQAKARELAAMAKEQEVTRVAKISEQPVIFERPHRRPPLLPLPPGPPLMLTVPLPRPPPILFPPPPLMPPKDTVVLADDMAPGVSEDDKNILAMPMCPRPLPPPTIFRDHVNKLEKKNSSLAAGNAKDLYDIFYNSSGRSPADSKLMNSANSDKGKINPVERERNTDQLVVSKPSNATFAQECSSSDGSKIPLGDGTIETEVLKAERTSAACEENKLKIGAEREVEKISFLDTQSTFKYREASESNNLAKSASVSFQNEVEIGTPAPTEFKKSPEALEEGQLTIQIPERSILPLDNLRKSTDLETADFKIPNDNKLTVHLSEASESNPPTGVSVSFQNELKIGIPSTEFNKNSPVLEEAELARQLPESSISACRDDSKNLLEFETTEFKSYVGNKLAIQSSELATYPLEDVSKKPLGLEIEKLPMQLPEENVPSLEDDNKKVSDFEMEGFKSSVDNKLAVKLPEYSVAPLDVSKKPPEIDGAKLSMQLTESSDAPLEVFPKVPLEFETAELKALDDQESTIQLLDYTTAALEDVSKKPPQFETAGLAMHLPDTNAPPLEALHRNPLESEVVEFKSPEDTELAIHLPEKEANLRKESVVVKHVDATSCDDISEKLQDQQNKEVYGKSKLEEIKNDLKMKAYMTNLGERDVALANYNFAVSQGDNPQLFEMQIEIAEEEGPSIKEKKQIDDNSEQTISTLVSDISVQSQVACEPIDLSSKVSEENPQIVVQDQCSSKESSLDLKLGTVELDRLEPAMIDESPHTSEVLNRDPESSPLNKGELDSSHTNNEEFLVNSQPEDSEAFNIVSVPKSGDMLNMCLADRTVISSTSGKYEKNNQPLGDEAKDLQVEEAKTLGIKSANDAETSRSLEVMPLQNDKQRSAESDIELSGMEETNLTKTENVNFSTIQPEIVQETLNVLPKEGNVGHLGEEALTFTDMNTGILHTSAANDFDLSASHSELSFVQRTSLTLSLNAENDKDSLKPGEVKPTDPNKLKTGLELETIRFSLGNIEMEREHLSILPSEILNKVETPKLETIAPICLESNKTSGLGIALASGDQEKKICFLVSDAIVSDMGCPESNGDIAEPNMSLAEMQSIPQVSEVLQVSVSKDSNSDMSLLSYVEKNVQNQAAVCMESLHPELRKTSVEVGGSGDSIKSQMQTSGGELIKPEEENNDSRCEVNIKLASEVTENSTENLVSSNKISSNA